MQHKEQKKSPENSYRENLKRPNKVKPGKLKVMKWHVHLTDTLRVTNSEIGHSKPSFSCSGRAYIPQMSKFPPINCAKHQDFCCPAFLSQFWSIVRRDAQGECSMSFWVKVSTWPHFTVVFGEHLTDSGLQPPLPLAAAPPLLCCVCLQCRRLQLRPPHGLIQSGDLGNFNSHSKAPGCCTPSLPRWVSSSLSHWNCSTLSPHLNIR